MKRIRYKARIIREDGRVTTHKVFKDKSRGLFILTGDSSYVSIEDLEAIGYVVTLKKVKSRIRENSFLDWVRGIMGAIAIIAAVSLPSAIVAII